MGRRYLYLLSCLLILCKLTFTPANTHAQNVESLTFVDIPFPPYIFGEYGEEAIGGITVTIVKEVFSGLDIQVDVELVPWKRALAMAKTGEADGLTGLMVTEEREQYLLFTDEILMSREFIYYNSKYEPDMEWENYEDLLNYSIGLVSGFAYGEDFLDAADRLSFKIEYADTSESNMRKLYAGYVDILLEDEMMANYLLKNNHEWSAVIKHVSKPVSSYTYHIALSKKSPVAVYIDRVNEIIAEMKLDGRLEEILNQSFD